MRANKWRIVPLLTWTFVVWISRTRNVLTNQDLEFIGVAWRLGAAGIFLALAAAVSGQLISGHQGVQPLKWLATWSIGFWLIRGTGILIDSNWSFEFKAVHSALMIVTFAMVALAISRPRLRE
ncbi:MAG: hypothetical protein VX971_04790 [Actinomycetota bacterium]|nr:hypothetical protein [Actinomycetota bacterium]MEC9338929.1 hypothetical protein [Actinomycetota bacterium]